MLSFKPNESTRVGSSLELVLMAYRRKRKFVQPRLNLLNHVIMD